MGVTITYNRDGRMTFGGIECACGLRHSLPTQDIYVGKGLLNRLPDYIAARGWGRHCELVADNNTWPLAGEQVDVALQSAGYSVARCVIPPRQHDGPG